MANVPPCCPPGSWPQLVASKDDPPEPKGTVCAIKTSKEEEDLKVYYVEPTSGAGTTKGGILVLQDVYSIRVFAPDSSKSTDRTVAICDALAEAGYAVVLLDLFGAEALDLAVAAPDEDKGQDYTNFDVFAAQGGPEWFAKQIKYEDKHRHKLCRGGRLSDLENQKERKAAAFGLSGLLLWKLAHVQGTVGGRCLLHMWHWMPPVDGSGRYGGWERSQNVAEHPGSLALPGRPERCGNLQKQERSGSRRSGSDGRWCN